ncbi:MAG TPA: alpha/beta fold hydrolase [Pirellulales bacterium]|nr:alpha/beta fold hydrolase [Pirellulales bacterium]
MSHSTPIDEVVVLVHGLGANRLVMCPLARWLRQAGFRTVNWSYPSFLRTIERHGLKLRERLERLDADPTVARIHLVAHSMGCIVARQALVPGRPRKAGRFVMMAPPNQGSPLAAFFGPPLRWCFPTIDQLARRPDSFVNGLPKPDEIEIGVIAAQVDWLVGVANTHLSCQRDHIVVRGTHSLMVFQPGVAREVIEFLRQGRFTAASRRRGPRIAGRT